MEIRFTKMHGLGNDFIMLEDDGITDYTAVAGRLCERNTGIGADGLIIVCKSEHSDAKMRIINSDGSEAQMCGNGIRCFSKYVYERGIVKKNKFTVETLAGVMRPELNLEEGKVKSVTVDMGEPSFDAGRLPMKYDGSFIEKSIFAEDRELCATAVLMGVPHLIVFDEVDKKDIPKYGESLEHNALFPERTNVDFVRVADKSNIYVTTWERGCGITLACGTGSCASACACMKTGRVNKDEVTVHIALGELNIRVNNGRVFMTGEACEVFTGTIKI